MDFNSPWISLGPLLAFNLLFLSTVLIFRPIYRNRERLAEVEDRHASKLLNRWMREYWLWLTDPCVRLFVRLGISPNTLTFIGVCIALISALFFAMGRFGLGGWFMIFAATFDIFDGRVARATKRETKSGAYFDSVMDRVSEGLIFAALAWCYRGHGLGLAIVLMSSLTAFMVSYAKARGDADGAKYSGGSMQRPERVVYMGVGAIFTPMFAWPFLGQHPDLVANMYLVPLGFVGLMCAVTSVDRMKHVMQLLK